jgi:hypothetical protein
MRIDVEKRVCARLFHEAPVVIEECGTSEYHEGRMYNYGRGGMYVETDLDLKPGARVNLWLSDLPENSFPEINFAEVRWREEITGAVVLYNFGFGIKYYHPVKHLDFPGKFRVLQGGLSTAKGSEK